jgi:hypothetical protein
MARKNRNSIVEANIPINSLEVYKTVTEEFSECGGGLILELWDATS